MDLAELEQKLAVFNDPLFHFDEEKHLYNYNGRVLKSGTAITKLFKIPFDALGKSQKIAAETGADPADIRAMWANSGKVATTMGTDVHKYIEDYYTPGVTPQTYTDPETLFRIQLFLDVIAPRLGTMVPVRQELRIFSLTKGICGTIDALFWKDGKLYILDWKTNGKFRRDRDHAFQMLLPPFQDYKEVELNEYSIQLNLYKLILAEHGIDVADCVIVSIPPLIGKDKKPMAPELYKCKNFIPHLESFFESLAAPLG